MKEAIAKYVEAIKADYAASYANPKPTDNLEWIKKSIEEFNNGVEVWPGKKYLKVVVSRPGSRSVHSFIVTEDDKQFKKGDILKAASWNAPAKNKARGNILGEYRTRWTGAEYLR